MVGRTVKLAAERIRAVLDRTTGVARIDDRREVAVDRMVRPAGVTIRVVLDPTTRDARINGRQMVAVATR